MFTCPGHPNAWPGLNTTALSPALLATRTNMQAWLPSCYPQFKERGPLRGHGTGTILPPLFAHLPVCSLTTRESPESITLEWGSWKLQGIGQRESSETASRSQGGTDNDINKTSPKQRSWRSQKDQAGTHSGFSWRATGATGCGLALLGRQRAKKTPTDKTTHTTDGKLWPSRWLAMLPSHF